MRIDGSCLVYADDTQVYVATQASNLATAMERLTNCIVKIRDWMAMDPPTTGFLHFYTGVLSKFSIKDACLQSSSCYSAFHRGLS